VVCGIVSSISAASHVFYELRYRVATLPAPVICI
jgi:hypothetical protein